MSPKVAAIGETLWDLFPAGRQLGGAPANFACHVRALGGSVKLISRVGNDELGREMLGRLEKMGLRSDTVSVDPLAPTGTAGIQLDDSGQPHFVIQTDSAWDRLTAEAPAMAAVAAADAVYFGTLGQRSSAARRTYRELLSQANADALLVCDLNLRQEFFSPDVLAESLERANVVKLNDAELPVVADVFELPTTQVEFVEELAARFDLRVVAVTRGGHGSLLYSEGRLSTHPGKTIEVRDTVGAGDAFTAALTMGLLSGWELDEINQLANDTAAEVCSQSGATPPLSANLCERLQAVTR